jgi:HAMP domain-containing protein
MESAATVTLVLAGLFFSLMCALLMEELIFGGLFRFFLVPLAERPQQKMEAGRKA